jgi:hypothetical protein
VERLFCQVSSPKNHGEPRRAAKQNTTGITTWKIKLTQLISNSIKLVQKEIKLKTRCFSPKHAPSALGSLGPKVSPY